MKKIRQRERERERERMKEMERKMQGSLGNARKWNEIDIVSERTNENNIDRGKKMRSGMGKSNCRHSKC